MPTAISLAPSELAANMGVFLYTGYRAAPNSESSLMVLDGFLLRVDPNFSVDACVQARKPHGVVRLGTFSESSWVLVPYKC
jgi:hypothetical protein